MPLFGIWLAEKRFMKARPLKSPPKASIVCARVRRPLILYHPNSEHFSACRRYSLIETLPPETIKNPNNLHIVFRLVSINWPAPRSLFFVFEFGPPLPTQSYMGNPICLTSESSNSRNQLMFFSGFVSCSPCEVLVKRRQRTWTGSRSSWAGLFHSTLHHINCHFLTLSWWFLSGQLFQTSSPVKCIIYAAVLTPRLVSLFYDLRKALIVTDRDPFLSHPSTCRVSQFSVFFSFVFLRHLLTTPLMKNYGHRCLTDTYSSL